MNMLAKRIINALNEDIARQKKGFPSSWQPPRKKAVITDMLTNNKPTRAKGDTK